MLLLPEETKSGRSVHPCIYKIEGEGHCTYLVTVERIQYRFSSVQKAVDQAFKLHFALNLEYPTERNRSTYIFNDIFMISY
jgi:hypothetical protein